MKSTHLDHVLTKIGLKVSRPVRQPCQMEKLGTEPATAQLELGLGLRLAINLNLESIVNSSIMCNAEVEFYNLSQRIENSLNLN